MIFFFRSFPSGATAMRGSAVRLIAMFIPMIRRRFRIRSASLDWSSAAFSFKHSAPSDESTRMVTFN
jgi:hypothetical protein